MEASTTASASPQSHSPGHGHATRHRGKRTSRIDRQTHTRINEQEEKIRQQPHQDPAQIQTAAAAEDQQRQAETHVQQQHQSPQPPTSMSSTTAALPPIQPVMAAAMPNDIHATAPSSSPSSSFPHTDGVDEHQHHLMSHLQQMQQWQQFQQMQQQMQQMQYFSALGQQEMMRQQHEMQRAAQMEQEMQRQHQQQQVAPIVHPTIAPSPTLPSPPLPSTAAVSHSSGVGLSTPSQSAALSHDVSHASSSSSDVAIISVPSTSNVPSLHPLASSSSASLPSSIPHRRRRTEYMTPPLKAAEENALRSMGFERRETNESDFASITEPQAMANMDIIRRWLIKMELVDATKRKALPQTMNGSSNVQSSATALALSLTALYACKCSFIRYGQKQKALSHICNKHTPEAEAKRAARARAAQELARVRESQSLSHNQNYAHIPSNAHRSHLPRQFNQLAADALASALNPTSAASPPLHDDDDDDDDADVSMREDVQVKSEAMSPIRRRRRSGHHSVSKGESGLLDDLPEFAPTTPSQNAASPSLMAVEPTAAAASTPINVSAPLKSSAPSPSVSTSKVQDPSDPNILPISLSEPDLLALALHPVSLAADEFVGRSDKFMALIKEKMIKLARLEIDVGGDDDVVLEEDRRASYPPFLYSCSCSEIGWQLRANATKHIILSHGDAELVDEFKQGPPVDEPKPPPRTKRERNHPSPANSATGRSSIIPPLPSSCAHCDRSNCELLQCSACLRTVYCSAECQRANWKLHRDACRRMQAQMKQQQPAGVDRRERKRGPGRPRGSGRSSFTTPAADLTSASAALSSIQSMTQHPLFAALVQSLDAGQANKRKQLQKEIMAWKNEAIKWRGIAAKWKREAEMLRVERDQYRQTEKRMSAQHQTPAQDVQTSSALDRTTPNPSTPSTSTPPASSTNTQPTPNHNQLPNDANSSNHMNDADGDGDSAASADHDQPSHHHDRHHTPSAMADHDHNNDDDEGEHEHEHEHDEEHEHQGDHAAGHDAELNNSETDDDLDDLPSLEPPPPTIEAQTHKRPARSRASWSTLDTPASDLDEMDSDADEGGDDELPAPPLKRAKQTHSRTPYPFGPRE